MKYIVELEENVWIADWDGDPGRTIVKNNAKVFDNKKEAEESIKMARYFGEFKFAKIIQQNLIK